MKNAVKNILQKTLGFSNYLFVFSIFKIFTIYWDKKERDFLHLLKLIPPNCIVLDIGANIGIMTYFLSRKTRAARVFCFEPVHYNNRVLKKIIKLFNLKNITVFDFALGNETAEIKMVVPVVNTIKMQGLAHVLHHSINEYNDGEIITVQQQTLDSIDVLNDDKCPVKAIKIDVENFEYYVLQGATKLIKQHKPIIYIELWNNENRQKCFALIKQFGYKIKILQANELAEFDSKLHQTQNFFFLPE